ncbi:MAG: hypothetical protein ACR2N0_13790 [Rubrobacteraceae bacterium]|jgi:hypothetical protein
MLSVEKFQILEVCADGPELFYFPFAEVNYGGQVVPGSWREPGVRRFERFEDEGPWTVEVPGEVVASNIAELVEAGLLRCERVSFVSEHAAEFAEVSNPSEAEFEVYAGYGCVTWDEHFEKFGYGPHEFTATAAEIAEIHKPDYEDYVRRLGWE